jgi:hypothetical protein
LNGAQRVRGAHAHQGNLQVVTEEFERVEHDPLRFEAAGQQMMSLIDDQHFHL